MTAKPRAGGITVPQDLLDMAGGLYDKLLAFAVQRFGLTGPDKPAGRGLGEPERLAFLVDAIKDTIRGSDRGQLGPRKNAAARP